MSVVAVLLVETCAKRSHCCPTIVFPAISRKRPCGFAFQFSEDQLDMHFLSLFSMLAQSITLLHTLECIASFVVLYSTHKTRITGTSELHASFKNRYIYHWLTYLSKTLGCPKWLPDMTSHSIKIKELFPSYVEKVCWRLRRNGESAGCVHSFFCSIWCALNWHWHFGTNSKL